MCSVWNAPATESGIEPGLGRRVGLEGVELLERAGGDDLAGAVVVGGGEAVPLERGERPRRGRRRGPRSCRWACGAAASAIARPRSRTSTMACSAEMTPVPAAAVISPTLCPAPRRRRGTRRRGAGRSPARRPGRRRPAAAGRRRCRGWSRRRPRCRSGPGPGRRRRTASAAGPRSAAARARARGSRASGRLDRARRWRAPAQPFGPSADARGAEPDERTARSLEGSYKPVGSSGVGQPAEGQRDPQGEGLPGVRRGVAADLGDPAQPVPHGVGVHEQRPRGGLQRRGLLEEGRQRSRAGRSRSTAAAGRSPAPAAPGPARRRRAPARAAGRRPAPGGARPARPARRSSPATAAAALSPAASRSGTAGPTTTGPGPNCGDQQPGGPDRVDVAAEDGDQPVALHAGEDVEVGRAGHPPDLVDHRFRLGVRRVPDHDDHRVVAAPAQRRGPGPQRVVGLAAQQGVDDQGLQPGVPGAAGLGRLGVDLGGGEGDLAGVAQHRLADDVLVAGGDLLDLLLDHGDHHADQLDGLLQGDRAGQLARRGAEDVGADRLRGVRLAEPLDERGDAGLGDQVDPGPVLRRHRAVPGQHLVHARDRGASRARPCWPRGGAP